MTDTTATTRDVPLGLGAQFARACHKTVDICEHLPLLRDLAQECEHVTEIGVRNADGSTVAFLVGQPSTLVSWDLNPWAIVSQPVADLLALGAPHADGRWRVGRTLFQPRVGDSTQILIEPTDLLFIDSYHTARQLKNELEHLASPPAVTVRKYLVFHDTITFGEQGEDGSSPGLRAAIRWFQREHAFPLWQLVEDRPNNNGLVVLKRAV